MTMIDHYQRIYKVCCTWQASCWFVPFEVGAVRSVVHASKQNLCADDIKAFIADGVTTITLVKEVQSTQKVHIGSSLDVNRH
ncbi:hypothetical protein BC938DRAFT_483987 [Jimgerdemannia flammicorona]|uniref:Uncharacterized protein n=1 Tax=Jimgerdemannia flammicorona TaxID=994334 RepID=A0A433QVI8_9FUNG|nr:hypothetical protein BC938DRAFT_483987 [Jimgerdemannia flammicorona]